jgi:hypothetical protein
MALVLRAIHQDGTKRDVEIKQIDFVKFEAHFGISWNTALQNLSNTQLLWLAHQQQRRTNATALEFEPWVETIDDLEFGDKTKKSNP